MTNPEAFSLKRSTRRRWPRQLGLVVLLLVFAVGGALLMMNSAPKAARKPAEKPARLVETIAVSTADHTARIVAMGRVVAAREATLYPEVTGTIVAVNDRFVPGGQVKAGEELLRLDEADYRLAVRQRESAVAQAKAALAQEQGQQRVAVREYELLGEALSEGERALVLREPQLASAKATLADANAALDRARKDLERTVVRAPFDGIIVDKSVALGTRVSSSTPLLTLVAADSFWVQVDLPVELLGRMLIPASAEEAGSPVKLRRRDWPQGIYREGRVLRLIPRLEAQARLAQVLVEVRDPLARLPEHERLPPLLVNDYLQASIEGETLNGTIALDRSLLRGGDRVWVLEAGQLVVRTVDVAFRGEEQVFIRDGLKAGDQVVATDLSAPVPGMALRIREPKPAAAGEPTDV